MVVIAGDRGGNMSEENKRKLNEQLVRCVLDDKLPVDKKLRKMDYIIKLGADVNAESGLGFSVLSLAKMMQNDELVNFLEEKGANDIGFDSIKAEEFFESASVEEINNVLQVLPDGYKLDCDVDLSKRGLTELPDFSRVVVNGDFYCEENQLVSLRGAPREVGGLFYCSHNKLISLKDGPVVVGGDYNCSNNQLDSLEDGPNKVRGDYNCSNNELDSLKGAPVEVGGNFVCYSNNLTSLKGAPREVKGKFDCSINQLISLEGAPSKVERDFNCSYNPLKSYKGKPDKIGGEFRAPKIEQVTNINGGNVR